MPGLYRNVMHAYECFWYSWKRWSANWYFPLMTIANCIHLTRLSTPRPHAGQQSTSLKITEPLVPNQTDYWLITGQWSLRINQRTDIKFGLNLAFCFSRYLSTNECCCRLKTWHDVSQHSANCDRLHIFFKLELVFFQSQTKVLYHIRRIIPI